MEGDIVKYAYEEITSFNDASDKIKGTPCESLCKEVQTLVDKVFAVLATIQNSKNEVLCNKLREALLNLLINVAKTQEKRLRKIYMNEVRSNAVEVRELLKTAERLGIITGARIKSINSMMDKVYETVFAMRR